MDLSVALNYKKWILSNHQTSTKTTKKPSERNISASSLWPRLSILAATSSRNIATEPGMAGPMGETHGKRLEKPPEMTNRWILPENQGNWLIFGDFWILKHRNGWQNRMVHWILWLVHGGTNSHGVTNQVSPCKGKSIWNREQWIMEALWLDKNMEDFPGRELLFVQRV